MFMTWFSVYTHSLSGGGFLFILSPVRREGFRSSPLPTGERGAPAGERVRKNASVDYAGWGENRRAGRRWC